MKKFAGCVIKENTITLTKAFAKQAYTPGTAEFRYLAELHKAFPDFPIVQRTAKPNDDKEKHGGLTITRMEFGIMEKSMKTALDAAIDDLIKDWDKEIKIKL